MNYLLTNRKYTPTGFGTDRYPLGLTCWTCPSDPAVFSNWSLVTVNTFLAALTKPPLLFVHGFNNSEVKSEAMSEQIQKNLPEYNVIDFDWYSLGHVDLISYQRDRSRARSSASDLYKAIRMFEDVDVLCHSMGNYVLQNALPEKDQLKLDIERLIMVAADIDNTTLPLFKGCTREGMVAYCCEDGALDGSTVLHLLEADGLPRLGLTGPIGRCPASFMRVNCTTMLSSERNPIAKHSAYFFNKNFYTVLRAFLSGDCT